MRFRALLPWPLLASLCCGCGQETVMLASAAGSDASIDAHPADAAVECSPGQPGTCSANGAKCSSQASCCSNRCESGYCLLSGACMSPGSTCTARSRCCSGRCEPRGGGLECLGYCAADGAPCDTHQDCCSLDCHGGTCGGATCVVAGSSCTMDEDCCSSSCDNGTCALDSTTACRASGESCGSDAGVDCCSGVCNTATSRCDLGPGACREPGTPCVVDGDCCRGTCAPNASGLPVCTAPCLGDGADCNSAGDCCSAVCSGLPSRCGGASCRD